jgi:hypothetical protein
MEMGNELFLQLIKEGRRCIPLSIDTANAEIKWLDFEQYHFYEGFFHKSHQVFAALKRGELSYVTTNLDILLEDAVADGCLYPSGFIFHASRSGSTLLSKVLARSTKNHVISEAEPLNAIWNYFAQREKISGFTDEQKKKFYRNLVMAFGRPNGRHHQHYFVKFTSFNILFFEFIHAVFPSVPVIFIGRDVDNIIKSFDKRPPGWLQSKEVASIIPGADTTNLDPRAIIESFLTEARKYSPEVLLPVNYKELTPELLPAILKHFNANADAEQLRLMQKQFAFDSKVEFNQKKFNSF